MSEDNPISRLNDTRLPLNVLEIEESIRFAPVESLYVISPIDGSVIFSKIGDEDSIYITDEECLLLEGNIVTHNHPFDEYAISVSLSDDDVLCAAANQAVEVRAVTPTDKFSIRPPKTGWSLNYCFDVLLPAIEALRPQIRTQISTEIAAGLITEPEANRVYWHRLWSTLAPQLGFTYESSFNLEQARQTQPHPSQDRVQETQINSDNGDTDFRSFKKAYDTPERPSKLKQSQNQLSSEEEINFYHPEQLTPSSEKALDVIQKDQQKLAYRQQYQQLAQRVRHQPKFANYSTKEVDVAVAMIALKESLPLDKIGGIIAQSDQIKEWKRSMPHKEMKSKAATYIQEVLGKAESLRQHILQQRGKINQHTGRSQNLEL